MPALYDAATIPVDGLKQVGIGIYREGAHIGLLYRRTPRSPVLLLHFCFHRKLVCAAPDDQCQLWVAPEIAEEHATSVVANALLVLDKNRNGTLPYGFSDPH